ncbi:MAG TPA: tetratricopeptide repeat protein [Candidatus Binatia bacterium]
MKDLFDAITLRLNLRRLVATATIGITPLYGCVQQPSYRTPVPLSSGSATNSRIPSTPLPAPAAVREAAPRAFPQEDKIREQDIRSKTAPAPPAIAKETKEPQRQASIVEPAPTQLALPPPLADDSSLLAKITPGTSPQRAASLRLTEEGRKILDAGEPAKALSRLEKTIVIDSTNPYGYFYLAKAQFRLGHYQESLNFLNVAESRVGSETFWLAEIYALRGENYRAQGQLQKAEASYNQAIRLNSGNRTAADALTRLQADSSGAIK